MYLSAQSEKQDQEAAIEVATKKLPNPLPELCYAYEATAAAAMTNGLK